MKLFLYVCATLLTSAGVLLTTSPALAGPRPRPQAWRGFHGPAYLGQMPPRPSQHALDSAANAARARKAKLAAR